MDRIYIKKVVFAVTLFFSGFSLISFTQPLPRQMINLDEGWKFHLGHAAYAKKDFNFTVAHIHVKSGTADGTAISPRFDDSNWRTVDLPHDWAVELPFVEVYDYNVMAHGYKPVGGLFPETSVGWYRKHFTMNKADSGYRYVIRFDGIFRDSEIWLNGFYLGNNMSGYIGVDYDITDVVNFNGNNVLVVRVDASQYEGWFYEGAGIYRHVWLIRHDNLHIPAGGLFVYSSNEGRTVHIETMVENKNMLATGCTVASYITDREGNILFRTPEQELPALLAHDRQTVKQEVSVPNPRLWSLEDPYLYRAVSVVMKDGVVTDRVMTRFGIRTITVDADRGLFLNGKPVKIYGVNCHQDHAGLGSALPDYLQYYRIRLLKEMGVNAYRTSHNPPTPELLDACDSLGLLVLDETRMLSSSHEHMDQLERLVLRDRNHPSVFMWSIGNEEFGIQATGYGKRIALSMLAHLRGLDPTRTATYASDLGNVFRGVNEVIPVRGFNYRIQFIDDYHRDHPEQPIVGTEMGSTVTTRGIYEKDTIRCYVPDQDISAPWWATTAEYWWSIAATRPWFMGGFIWTGFDYRGEPTPYHWPNINSHFGVMDMCGFPKNIYYYYQSWWTDKDVLHISPHWNWEGREGDSIDVWVNSNAREVQLFLNGKSLGRKEMPRYGHLQWKVPYRPGTLEAVAKKDGKKIRAKVETTGRPSRVVLTPDRTIISADGKDATVINVSVKDLKSREVPDADNLIKFRINGDAKIIGVGNGDPSSHEPDKCMDGQWQRKLFGGKCQLIIQAGKTTGTVQVEALSEGLETAVAEISLQ